MTQTRRFKIETLVRDKMPEKIQKLGGRLELHQLDKQEILSHLKHKLCEEVTEVCKATDSNEVQEEIGDVLEVLNVLAKKHGLEWEQIEQSRFRKYKERGGFERGIYVKYIEVDASDNSCPAIQYYLNNPEKYPEIS
ncbi:MAG: nucleoside triphosphate pyrophosphohydrolase [Proteobacteria bacterium]|nr:nucleoside triphosphate pyrophosphohydrolase [Pseudomonadota bacterium]